MKLSTLRFYSFDLRGFHSLHQIEPTHGHSALLNIGLLSPVEEKQEGEFLCFIKNTILRDFDQNNWGNALATQPTGENVLLAIAERLKDFKKVQIRALELKETKKNSFFIEFK